MSSKTSIIILWFKKDLRIHDHTGIFKALKQCNNNKDTRIISLYCIDPREYELTRWNNKKTDSFRTKFLYESLKDLHDSLNNSSTFNNGLHVLYGKPEEKIPLLCNNLMKIQSGKIYCEEEITDEELRIEKLLINNLPSNWSLETHWSSTLHHKDDLPINSWNDIPDSFTPFRKLIENNYNKPRELIILNPNLKITLPLPDNFNCEQKWSFFENELKNKKKYEVNKKSMTFNFVGGEKSGLNRLHDYIFNKDLLRNYFDTRNGMLGSNYSTKFSPWIAFGCLSPRKIYYEVKKYENERISNKSTYWLIFELLWRDYFKFYFKRYGSRPFHSQGVKPRSGIKWDKNNNKLERWKKGETGYPLVDANMRELSMTGFMSNRGRQNVASFLIHDLGLDWRLGADYMESLLIDYDVCSNWGNWHALAGLQGGRINKFNIIKQSHQYDGEGKYIRYWIPELKDFPVKWIHEPHQIPKKEASAIGFQIGKNYPFPIKKVPYEYNSKKDKNNTTRLYKNQRKQRQLTDFFQF